MGRDGNNWLQVLYLWRNQVKEVTNKPGRPDDSSGFPLKKERDDQTRKADIGSFDIRNLDAVRLCLVSVYPPGIVWNSQQQTEESLANAYIESLLKETTADNSVETSIEESLTDENRETSFDASSESSEGEVEASSKSESEDTSEEVTGEETHPEDTSETKTSETKSNTAIPTTEWSDPNYYTRDGITYTPDYAQGTLLGVLEVEKAGIRRGVYGGSWEAIQHDLDIWMVTEARPDYELGKTHFAIYGHNHTVQDLSFNRLKDVTVGDVFTYTTDTGIWIYDVTRFFADWRELVTQNYIDNFSLPADKCYLKCQRILC